MPNQNISNILNKICNVAKDLKRRSVQCLHNLIFQNDVNQNIYSKSNRRYKSTSRKLIGNDANGIIKIKVHKTI